VAKASVKGTESLLPPVATALRFGFKLYPF